MRESLPLKLNNPSVGSSPIHKFPNPSSVSAFVCPPTKAKPVDTGTTRWSAGV